MGTTTVLKSSVYLRFNHLTLLLAWQNFTELSHHGNFRWHNVEYCGSCILSTFLKVLQVSNWSVQILLTACINSKVQLKWSMETVLAACMNSNVPKNLSKNILGYLIYKAVRVCVCVCVCVCVLVCILYKFRFLNQSEPNFAHISPLVRKRL
jgi:hypothetical protein